ncbi:siderophore-interacting protein [Taibaiella koreensis]|uniref:siderophore-interacting protein n=1 Tax=Taibaiella koreensis TaxID=1268548 RepID=UPI000E59BCF5|nr:siderophore-interacting protein [Taibaiella koreensis]
MEKIIKSTVRAVFTVKEKIFLTPHYIRIVLAMTEEQVALFRDARTGAHNKIFIPAPGTDQILFPDEASLGVETLSVRRTYTTRRIDYDGKELWIDFVAHGDNGPASSWAQRAVAGSVLGVGMKTHSKPLFPEAAGYLFVGDSTAIPVIGVMLEQLPAGIPARAIIEVSGKDDEMDLRTEAHLHVDWVHNAYPERGSRLATIVKAAALPDGKCFAFVAAEYDTAKELRRYFKEELAWPPEACSVTSYWRRGESEDQSALQRREERGG